MNQDPRKTASFGRLLRLLKSDNPVPWPYSAVIAVILAATSALILAGCQTPGRFRVETDERALDIIASKQEQVLGRKSPFTIERSGDLLRRKLLEDASLPITGPASLGSDRLTPVAHWPEPGYPDRENTPENTKTAMKTPLILSMAQALEIGALNSPDYQTRKENIFQAALALYLEQDTFRNSLLGQFQGLISADESSDPSQQGAVTSADISLSRQFENGTVLTTALAVDLATLLNTGSASSIGIAGDASLSIPLLRGSGRHIVTEPLQQAERNVIYAILDFERFKKEYAVSVGSNYLSILLQMDTVRNTREDYQTRKISARRSRRLAEAGRLKEIEVDQAEQNELVARQRWVSAQGQLKTKMDSFKSLIGLPPDADINLDPDEFKRLTGTDILAFTATENLINKDSPAQTRSTGGNLLQPPERDSGHAGPLEIAEQDAINLALANRLDLQKAMAQVIDAQRTVVVDADALGAELTLLGSASLGDRRAVSTADLENARLRLDEGFFSALLTLDLPLERTAEAVTYRNSFILLEQSVRNFQALEDTIKLDVRNRLRELLEARETLAIQAKAVSLALKRVKSITLFMDAGRAETRDLLEAQDSLLSAQIALTSARVNYRIAELEIQRDMGVLLVTDSGLWQEYTPEKKNNVKH